MHELDALTRKFLETHPQAAATELERLEATKVAAVLAGAPAHVIAPVLAAMRRRAAADALMALDAETAAPVLGALRATAAAGILRHVPEPQRRPMIESLPAAIALACRALLRYPEDAVGAFTQTQILLFSEDSTASQALDAVRQQPDAFDSVLVITSEQRLVGRVGAAALLRAEPTQRLSAIAQPMARLPALMPIASALESPAFAHEPAAAVLEHGDRLLGIVTLATLRRALAPRTPASAATDETAIGTLAYAYWSSVAGLAQAAVGILMSDPRPPR